MQSADGFLKIGRSKNPETRRATLENERWRSVVLVAEFANRGDEERAILGALHAHRHRGEWFRDKPACRAMLVALLGELKFKPYQGWDKDPRTDPDAALGAWLAKQEQRRSKQQQTAGTKFIPLVKPRWDLASFTQGTPAG